MYVLALGLFSFLPLHFSMQFHSFNSIFFCNFRLLLQTILKEEKLILNYKRNSKKNWIADTGVGDHKVQVLPRANASNPVRSVPRNYYINSNNTTVIIQQ